MFNVVTGSAGPISDVLCTHGAIRVISFTGSTEVGRQLETKCARHIKRLGLELGGNAPFVVFEDANLNAAATALLANKFRATGQTCVCTNRVYAQQTIADAFTDKVAALVRRLRVGDGMNPETEIGPLINRDGFLKVAEHVKDALAGGATRVVGEDPPTPSEDWGCFYPPTVLKNVQPEMHVCQEETFGPLVAISQFDNEQEVIAKANDTEFGLAAYLFTADRQRADRCAAALQFGHVGINTGQSPTPEAPFGGMKQSGYGREGGIEGLLEYCEYQTIVRGG
jgi:succinate-semialdehyde dehydrogenase/glutarate-semialdehyde dehydrogenase